MSSNYSTSAEQAGRSSVKATSTEPPATERNFMIMGYNVAFPAEKQPFPAQLAVMNKALLAMKTQQHALLESPTGSGKTLALLCSSLSFQKAYAKEAVVEEATKAEAYMRMAHENESKSHDNTRATPVTQEQADTQNVVKNGMSSAEAIEIDEDDDFASTQPTFESLKKNAWINMSYKRKSNDDEDISAYEPDRKKRETHSPSPDFQREDETPTPSMNVPPTSTKSKSRPYVPKIYFCSRTHSQLSQVVAELKSCPPSYLEIPDVRSSNPDAVRELKTCVLGSKTHYCVNKKANRDSAKVDEKCQDLLEKDACAYYRKGKRMSGMKKSLPPVWDIEDCVSLAKQVHECAYFASRDQLDFANVIFCPYNYLLDPSIRQAVGIELSRSIVILDEAHNAEDTCRDAASVELTQDALAAATHSFTTTVKSGRRPPCYSNLLRVLTGLQNWLQNVRSNARSILQPSGFEQESRVWNGSDALAVLQEYCKVDRETYGTLQNDLRAVSENERKLIERGKDNDELLLTNFAMNITSQVVNVIDFMLRENMRFLDDFKLLAIKKKAFVRKKDTYTADGWEYKLCLWCLNAAVAFSDLATKTRSVLLTSGTLSPMDSFSGELGTDFPIRLEANHVVNMKKQVFIGSIMQGPRDVDLSATYRNQQDLRYQDALGDLIHHFCKSVPGGLLVFFPSYSLLNKLCTRWRQTSLMQRLEVVKSVFMEPRKAGKDFDALLEQYKSSIAQTSGNSDSQTGALFFAVYRGKVSEGIDFSNENARAVLAVGIPFPHAKELQVDLKRKYQDEKAQTDPRRVTGSTWYNLQAYRALNQALGRCIRHRKDYGGIFLLDSRHRSGGTARSLSKWIRPHIQHFDRTNECLAMLPDFYSRNRAELGTGVVVKSEVKNEAHVDLTYEEDRGSDHVERSMASTLTTVQQYMERNDMPKQEDRVFPIFETNSNGDGDSAV